MRIIHQESRYRIVEVLQHDYDMDNLKGDCYKWCPTMDGIDRGELREEEKQFEYKVRCEGVYGYELHIWNPEIDGGWVDHDSCYGFVGKHGIDTHHYIVKEMTDTIKQLRKDTV